MFLRREGQTTRQREWNGSVRKGSGEQEHNGMDEEKQNENRMEKLRHGGPLGLALLGFRDSRCIHVELITTVVTARE
jgi:hypothetical protein